MASEAFTPLIVEEPATWMPSLYDLGEQIGDGSFSTVHACTKRSTGEVFACKKVLKSSLTAFEHVEDLRAEIAAMYTVADHPNVVRLENVYEDAEAVFLIMEFCAGGDLFELLEKGGKFDEDTAAIIFRQLVQAVHTCHSRGIMHRDLKLENVLLLNHLTRNKKLNSLQFLNEEVVNYSRMHVKLADFGLAVLLENGPSESGVMGLAGSAFYMAPEIIAGKPYGVKADMWSLGVLLYALLSGELPFAGARPGDIYRSIVRRGRLLTTSDSWKDVSPAAKSLVHWLLERDPNRRPSAREVLLLDWQNTDVCLKACKSILANTSKKGYQEVQRNDVRTQDVLLLPPLEPLGSKNADGNVAQVVIRSSSIPSDEITKSTQIPLHPIPLPRKAYIEGAKKVTSNASISPVAIATKITNTTGTINVILQQNFLKYNPQAAINVAVPPSALEMEKKNDDGDPKAVNSNFFRRVCNAAVKPKAPRSRANLFFNGNGGSKRWKTVHPLVHVNGQA